MLKITTTAIKQFKTIRRLDNTIMGFRLSLKSGGCNGFNYKLDSFINVDLDEGNVQLIDDNLYLQLCKKNS